MNSSDASGPQKRQPTADAVGSVDLRRLTHERTLILLKHVTRVRTRMVFISCCRRRRRAGDEYLAAAWRRAIWRVRVAARQRLPPACARRRLWRAQPAYGGRRLIRKMGFRLPPSLSAAPIVATDVAAASGRTPTPLRLTLYAKGISALVALVAYLTILGLYVAHEQGRLVYAHGQLEQLHAENELLTKVNTALTHSLVTLQALLNSGFAEPRFNDIELDFASLAPNLPELKATFPEITSTIRRFERHLSGVGEQGERDRLIALRDSGQSFAAELEQLETRIQGQVAQLTKEDLALIRSFTAIVSVAFLVGLAVFGSAVMVFFSRLASDIKSTATRAAAIIKGYRGKPLDVTRHDELGTLMVDVNRIDRKSTR